MNLRTMPAPAAHGGAFFEAVDLDAGTFEGPRGAIAADVLDAWFDPAPGVTWNLARHLPFLLRSAPPVDGRPLIRAIARARGLDEEQIVVAGGSSDLLYHVLLPAIERDATVLLFDPTYGEYARLCTLAGAYALRFALDSANGFAVDLDALDGCLRRNRPELACLVNPNNPTGGYVSRRAFVELIERHPRTTFVIDETYVDFVAGAESLERDAQRHANLIVVKSMSKAYALSGARCAYLTASRETIRQAAGLMPPWAVGLPAQLAAIEALADPAYYAGRYAKTRELARACVERAQTLPRCRVYETALPFYLLELDDGLEAGDVAAILRTQRIFVRDCATFSPYFNDRWLRVSVRNGEENARVAAALELALERT